MKISASDVLRVEDLCIYYHTAKSVVKAVNGVSFHIKSNEVFGLVGESGCGKTTLALGILRLIQNPGRIHRGKILFDDMDLVNARDDQIRSLRWKEIAYIPQGAMSSLNPVIKLRQQFFDVVKDHGVSTPKKEIKKQINDLLKGVHLSPSILEKYPHELSGGMKQRACIALAMVLEPSLIIADEPTSALDVVSQRVVLETLSKARQKLGASMILIGHDMAIQAQIADRIGIMYGGNFLEVGRVEDIFKNPVHPYTSQLITSIPSIKQKQDVGKLANSALIKEGWDRFLHVDSYREVEAEHYVAQHN